MTRPQQQCAPLNWCGTTCMPEASRHAAAATVILVPSAGSANIRVSNRSLLPVQYLLLSHIDRAAPPQLSAALPFFPCCKRVATVLLEKSNGQGSLASAHHLMEPLSSPPTLFVLWPPLNVCVGELMMSARASNLASGSYKHGTASMRVSP